MADGRVLEKVCVAEGWIQQQEEGREWVDKRGVSGFSVHLMWWGMSCLPLGV